MTVDPSAETAAEPSVPKPPGAQETLGKYRLDRVLGTGGMGIVWAAFDPDLERSVALKLLHTNDVPALRTRLLREARAMARLKHPNVLTVYEVGTDRNRDFIAMEIVDGDTLDKWVATKPSSDDLAEALAAAGRGLAAAHAAGLVHRDFKPTNVLRSRDGHIYVTDFGLARGQIEDGPEPVTQALPQVDILSSPLTQTGVMIGTPAYMAPEQFAGKPPDARSDQFAFCITVWEALTGARPFRGDSLPELQQAASSGVREVRADQLSPRVRDVLVRGLDPSPENRWPDMTTLLDALAAAMARPPRRRRVLLGIAGGAILVAGAGIFAATRAPSSSPTSSTSAPSPTSPMSPTPVVAPTPVEADCADPQAAFGDAWTAERRDRLVRQHDDDDDVVATVILLDDLRRRWLHEYAATCASAKGATRTQQLACLRDLRTEIRELTGDLHPDGQVTIVQIMSISSALGSCTGTRQIPFDLLGTPTRPPRPPPPPAPPPVPVQRPAPAGTAGMLPPSRDPWR